MANDTAADMVKRYGMSKKVGLRVLDKEESILSEEDKSNMNAEISRLLNESYARVMKLLVDHQSELELIATALLMKKTLYANELKTLIEDHSLKVPLQKQPVHQNGHELPSNVELSDFESVDREGSATAKI